MSEPAREPVLPRSSWDSQVAYLKAIFRAKRALDLAEREVKQGSENL